MAKIFGGDMLKNAGLQGGILSDHRMTTGFGSFELPMILYLSIYILFLFPCCYVPHNDTVSPPFTLLHT